MDSEYNTYLLFASPSEYYATCDRFFANLAIAVPEFYSDYVLADFCCCSLACENDEIRTSHPVSPPSRDTEVLLYTAAKLRLEPYDRETTGPILEIAVRAILKDFGLAPPETTTTQLLARLSLVEPKILVFPAEAEIEPHKRAFNSYRRLCVHFAQQLLPLPIFSGSAGQDFRDQLQQLSEYQLHDEDQGSLPCISPDDESQTRDETAWFEHIEAAALELTDEEDGKGFLRSAPQIIQRGIRSLSRFVYARPPFPNVRDFLRAYCKENGGDPWRYALETPTPRPLLWVKDFFTQVRRQRGPRIPVGDAAAIPLAAVQDEQPAVKHFRVRRDLTWPEEKSSSGELP